MQQLNFFERQGVNEPKIGFFVFNNALKAYLNSLAATGLHSSQYDVWTLDYWSRTFLENNGLLTQQLADDTQCKQCLREAIASVGLGTRQPALVRLGEDFLIEEVNYLLGRFGLDTNQYIASQREGRGNNPYIDNLMKKAIAEEIIPNYQLALEHWSQVKGCRRESQIERARV
ncbi:MAG: hypothetical protein R3A44_33350 [Caldilineaceae bacterium]